MWPLYHEAADLLCCLHVVRRLQVKKLPGMICFSWDLKLMLGWQTVNSIWSWFWSWDRLAKVMTLTSQRQKQRCEDTSRFLFVCSENEAIPFFFEIPSKLFRGLQTELLPLYGNYRYHGCLDRNELIYRFWIYLPFFGGAKPGFLFSQPCVFARFSYLLHRP